MATQGPGIRLRHKQNLEHTLRALFKKFAP